MIPATYEVPAGVLSAAAVIKRIVGPENMVGYIMGLSVVTTTALTGTEGTLLIGNPTDPNAYATLTLPNTLINERVDGQLTIPWDRGSAPAVNPDNVIEISAGGEPTAGAGNVFLHVEWR